MARAYCKLVMVGTWALSITAGCSTDNSRGPDDNADSSETRGEATGAIASSSASPSATTTTEAQSTTTTEAASTATTTSSSANATTSAPTETGATITTPTSETDSGDSSAPETSTADSSSTADTTSEADVPAAPFEFVPVDELPRIEEMPDPMTMRDGTKVNTLAQWRTRRQEMIQILEAYEYGHMPPPPGNVKATVVQDATDITTRDDLEARYRSFRLTFGPDDSLGMDLGLFTPASQEGAVQGRFPVLIYLTQNTNESSLAAASAALTRGYAVATVSYQQMGADAPNYAETGFFPAYPEYDWRDFSAWAWGLSRAVDYLVTDPEIDRTKILTTGVSRLAQAVLLAGAMDERIALTAPVAGGMAFRFSGKEMGDGLGQGITEVVDQNTYWFGPLFEEFRNQTPRLPCDQHWLLALTAPRLFILSNSLDDEYGRAYAAVQTYQEAKPVYAFLEAEQNLGIHFRSGGHGMTAENWSAILDFSDQYLLNKPGDRRFDELPPDAQLP